MDFHPLLLSHDGEIYYAGTTHLPPLISYLGMASIKIDEHTFYLELYEKDSYLLLDSYEIPRDFLSKRNFKCGVFPKAGSFPFLIRINNDGNTNNKFDYQVMYLLLTMLKISYTLSRIFLTFDF